MLRPTSFPQRRRPAGPRGTLRWAAACALGLALGACGDGGTIATESGPEEEIDPAQAVIDDWLDLRLDGPPSYSEPAWPSHYIQSIVRDNNVPEQNPTTDRGAMLGRVLFYDTELSWDRTISCASCHIQELGFTDSLPRSVGIEGGRTRLHSMRLANAMFYFGRDAFWDRRVPSFEEQAVLPILDRFEMGFTSERGGEEALIDRMEGLPYYPILFEWAFGTPTIDRDRIERSIAQFVRSIVSLDSEFDRAADAQHRITGELPLTDLPELGSQEREGFQLWMTSPEDGGVGCVACHRFPVFALDANSFNNGLDRFQDQIFKAPSLKNIAVTGPYMHDGRFATLQEVLEHYRSGVQDHELTDRRMKREDGTLGFPMTDAEMEAIIAFLGTLTDETLLADPKFSDPFIR